ncbi:MAG: XTP/dITP diphosphohydrolase [Gammaproteobacteria bacterium]|jgi:XTP/dITP diphosphohydrolase
MRTRDVVLATRNAGKVRELSQMLVPHAFHVIALDRFDAPDVIESAPTFVENALLKARSAAAATGLPAIADDSGLEVDFLDGAPGVYSARYAGANASDEQNVERLLQALAGSCGAARSARFRCAAVYLPHPLHPTPVVCQACWEGFILQVPRGEGGFGYDSVFLDPESGLSAAELTATGKNRVSHRAQAIRALVQALTRARHAPSLCGQPGADRL